MGCVMKKKVLFIICLFLLTGCDVVYNLDVKDIDRIESIKFNLKESDNVPVNENVDGDVDYLSDNLKMLTDTYYNEDYNSLNNDSTDKYFYEKKRNNDNSFSLNYIFNNNNYSFSNALNYCFENISVDDNEKYLIFDFKNSSVCFEQDIYDRLDKVTINIKTDYDVVSNNADEVNKNTYSWILSKKDIEKEIYIKMKKNKNADIGVWAIILFSIFIVGLIVFAVYYFRGKFISSNEF